MKSLKKIMSLCVLLSFYTILCYAQRNKNDTIFIKKTKNQKIFIAKELNTIERKELYNFEIDSSVKEISSKILLNPKKTTDCKTPLINNNEWIEIKKYKQKYYLYYPCDLYYLFKISISDSMVWLFEGEGNVGNIITNCLKKSNKLFSFKTINSEEEKKEYRFKLINSKKGIALLSVYSAKKILYTKTLVNKKMADSLGLIINECLTMKGTELN